MASSHYFLTASKISLDEQNNPATVAPMPKKMKMMGHARWVKGHSKNPVLLPDDLRTLGKNVEARREALDITQAALAQAAGVSFRTIVNIESCAMNGWPSTPVFLKISRTLGLPDPVLFKSQAEK